MIPAYTPKNQSDNASSSGHTRRSPRRRQGVGGRISISRKLFAYLALFTLFILAVVWIMQIGLLNYFIVFGPDMSNLLPLSWRAKLRRKQKQRPSGPKVVPFTAPGSRNPAADRTALPYTHRCTICGRTDVTDPQLEFRYCSRCKGYHCYCEDHISNHTHIE